jgi:hypothetical protein
VAQSMSHIAVGAHGLHAGLWRDQVLFEALHANNPGKYRIRQRELTNPMLCMLDKRGAWLSDEQPSPVQRSARSRTFAVLRTGYQVRSGRSCFQALYFFLLVAC